MLETVLEIGKLLRNSPNGLRHHRYVKQAPSFDKTNPVDFWTVPVNADGSFDFKCRNRLTNEHIMANSFYLNYKQGDADSTKKYIFGDVCRIVTKTGEDGNFKMGDPGKKSWMGVNSFIRGEDAVVLDSPLVTVFRQSFRTQLSEIETFLQSLKAVYIHFDFSGKGWHELRELALLNKRIVRSFFKKSDGGLVLQSFLFKTLAAGDSRTPGFTPGGQHRTHLFKTEEEALDLVYGVNYASRSTIRKNDIKVVILPRGTDMTAETVERFFERTPRPDIASVGADAEGEFRREMEPSFSFLSCEQEEERQIVKFDFIFSKAGGTQPDVDMIELTGVERSKLSRISSRIAKIRDKIQDERERSLASLFGKTASAALRPITITGALNNAFGDVTTEKKKYQRHLLAVLPKIYTDTYHRDPVLLQSLIRTTEASIRNGSSHYSYLKYDFAFLTSIQTSGETRLMELKNSPSYRIGLHLGQLAQPLGREINSFEKNYVGLLSRRIGTPADVIGFANDLRQKLVMHEKLYTSIRAASAALSEELPHCTPYNRDECAFGFFESYFAPFKGPEIPPPSGGESDQPELNQTNLLAQ